MSNFFKRRYLRICVKLKHAFDAIRNERFKNNLLQAIPFWIGSLITGVVAVGYAKLFSWAEELRVAIFHAGSTWFFIVTPICFLLS